jgi:SAM-dependent methyltransferase
MQKEVYKRHINNYSNHWWFQARKKIIETIIKKNIVKKNINILDFGSGSGVNVDMLSKYGRVNIFEPHLPTQNFLRRKFNSKKYSVIKEYTKKKFDLILLADVLEHIKNDKKIIQNLKKSLKNNGFILITVPSYKFLFSKKDLILGHYRRYSKSEVLSLFKNFEIVRLTFFNFILFFPISFTILLFKLLKIDFIDKVEKSPNKIINFILFKIFNIEKRLINHCNLPFGISMLGLFQKK